MLSDNHIALISRTREILKRLEQDTLTQHQYPYGRFGEACRAADDALFQVLLIAKHWLGEEEEESEIERQEETV